VGLLLVLSAASYVVGFVHLRADFPNGSPWMDWSKMTDEGWYGGAAIHHFVQGSWYLPDSFNPVVAMPVWPAMLGAWFAVTGVSMIAARTLTMLLYGVSLVLLYRVAWRARPGRLAAVVVLLTVINPFCYAFNRLALLEPVTVFWVMLALWLAGETRREDALRQVLLGVVVCLLVLTKMTGIALVPAVLYLMWARLGWPGLRGLRRRGVATAAVVVGTAAVLWMVYMRLAVRPHYLADYRLLFSINAYRVHLSIVPKMAWVTLRDGGWINAVLLWVAVVVGVLSVVWLRELWRVPQFGASVIAIVGQMAYIGYHTNFQPRYYLVIAMPLVLVIGLGVAAMWDRRRSCADGERLARPCLVGQPRGGRGRCWREWSWWLRWGWSRRRWAMCCIRITVFGRRHRALRRSSMRMAMRMAARRRMEARSQCWSRIAAMILPCGRECRRSARALECTGWMRC
jgi:4-amino-4-deoxy-L-arabinose transferase-like glycosyltransferase